MLLPLLSAAAVLAPSVLGAIVWDGRFNNYSTATDFDKWSWSNQVGAYQTSELIPQTTASLSGHLYFHVSLQIPTVNPPDPNYEHQIVFWEGHYADIKYGQLAGQNGVADVLRVITGGKTIWSVTPVKGTWYNFILETGSPGGLWVSTGGSALTKVYTGSLNGNGGTDWHIGALRLPNGNTNTITEENIYYSGVYVEDSGPTTTP
ncbi:hypothetical protein RSOLAG1IB_05567 [Rhizoctonia solani AG-1 IB]|uniref:Glycoside hydrolase 131 catalytic N-terminal domain-containing protein n=1 Tax=Thanatephorus cucumeris (strain AG1-IB / isolate 7/3/14) TaxID=1108050 RepID=A0A0B7G5N1_THACB|nr:hypothetical protein RSOLAG1IB_05567 [Rhizoctonia solani AG-1 IB]